MPGFAAASTVAWMRSIVASAWACATLSPTWNERVQSPHQPSGVTGWTSTMPRSRFHSGRSPGTSVGKQLSVPIPKPTVVGVHTPVPPAATTWASMRSRTSRSVSPGRASRAGGLGELDREALRLDQAGGWLVAQDHIIHRLGLSFDFIACLLVR